jgi:hypothetical protein
VGHVSIGVNGGIADIGSGDMDYIFQESRAVADNKNITDIGKVFRNASQAHAELVVIPPAPGADNIYQVNRFDFHRCGVSFIGARYQHHTED